ncbi:hypothetical protein GCM10009819_11840 [Agromyces tropicus]|uniref:Uncharacterized protein n=1 Tax=Agromyces tropicus TaxID=555371 RepID=A0ABP5FPE5_9MICO
MERRRRAYSVREMFGRREGRIAAAPLVLGAIGLVLLIALWARVPTSGPDPRVFPPGMTSTSAAELAERFLDVRTDHDIDAARAFLADRVRVLPMGTTNPSPRPSGPGPRPSTATRCSSP